MAPHGLILSLMCIFINPLYMLVIGSTIELYKKLPNYFNYVLAFSFAIAISNREIGVHWSSGNGIGIDDATNYLDWYYETATSSYIFGLGDLFTNLFSGMEPLWFILAELVGKLFLYNEQALIFFSTLIPIIIFHYSFRKITKYFCFCALVFYFLVPEIFHTLFHLYRNSIGLSIIVLCFAMVLSNDYIKTRLIYLAPLGHLSMILPASALFFRRFLFFNLSFINKIIYSLALSLFFFLGLYAMIYLASFLGLEKISFYLTQEGEVFQTSTRHLIYFVLSIYLISITNNKNVYLIALSTLLVLFLPFSLNGISIVFERILILFTPLLALGLAYESRNDNFKKIGIILLLGINFSLLAYKVHDQLFYQYMAEGKFFNFFSGIIHNIYTF